MTSELEVEAEGLRAWAAALRRIGDRIGRDLPPPVPGPRWETTAAAAAASDAALRQLSGLAEAITATGREVSGTADDYEDADERAARRLREIR